MSRQAESDWGIFDFRYANKMWEADLARFDEMERNREAGGFWSKRRTMSVARVKWYFRAFGEERFEAFINPLKFPLLKLFTIALMALWVSVVPHAWAQRTDGRDTVALIVFTTLFFAGLVLQLVFVRDAAHAYREVWEGAGRDAVKGIHNWLRSSEAKELGTRLAMGAGVAGLWFVGSLVATRFRWIAATPEWWTAAIAGVVGYSIRPALKGMEVESTRQRERKKRGNPRAAETQWAVFAYAREIVSSGYVAAMFLGLGMSALLFVMGKHSIPLTFPAPVWLIGGAFAAGFVWCAPAGILNAAKARGELLGLVAASNAVERIFKRLGWAGLCGLAIAAGVNLYGEEISWDIAAPISPIVRALGWNNTIGSNLVVVFVLGAVGALAVISIVQRGHKGGSFLGSVDGLADRITAGVARLWVLVRGLLWLGGGVIIVAVWSSLTDHQSMEVNAVYGVGAFLMGGNGLRLMIKALAFEGAGNAPSGLHGTSREATVKEVKQAGIFRLGSAISKTDEGPYLGQLVFPDGEARGQINYKGQKHLLTFGPPGSGKSTGLIVPNVKALPRSMIIIDPKGEIAAITARHRAKMGRVVIFNPFELLTKTRPWLKGNGFNPLRTLDPESDSFVGDASNLAEALIQDDSEKQPYFARAARDLTAAVIMWLRRDMGPAATLIDVRRTLASVTDYDKVDGKRVPVSGLTKTLWDMVQSDYEPIRLKVGPIIERLRDQGGPGGGIRDVLSSANTGMRFLDSVAVARDLQGAGFDFGTLREEITTVYLILPTKELTDQALWLRLVINMALRALFERTEPEEGTLRLPPPLFILEEFAQLGRLELIESALGAARGYGFQLWPFLQGLSQLQRLYPKGWKEFLMGSGATTLFALKNDFETAKYFAENAGQKTEMTTGRNKRQNLRGGIPDEGETVNEHGFPLYRPEDLRRLPKGQMICMLDEPKFPFKTFAPGYWETAFDTGLDPNPYAPD